MAYYAASINRLCQKTFKLHRRLKAVEDDNRRLYRLIRELEKEVERLNEERN